MMRERRKKGTGGCRWQRARCGWIRLREAEAVIFCYNSALRSGPPHSLQNSSTTSSHRCLLSRCHARSTRTPNTVCAIEQTQKHKGRKHSSALPAHRH